MSMSYEEAFESNLSAWMRRASLSNDKTRAIKRAQIAKKIMGESSRMGALFITSGIFFESIGVETDNRCKVIFAATAAMVIFNRVYESDTTDIRQAAFKIAATKFTDGVDIIPTDVVIKYESELKSFVERICKARNNEKVMPSLANQIIDVARGKRHH